MTRPQTAAVPAGSAIAARLAGASFHDCYALEVPGPARPALAYFLEAARSSPAWVERLMALRNRLVRLVGLKDLGGLGGIDPARSPDSYRPGDRVGIFTMIANGEDEALLGDDDRHLRVVLSVHRQAVAGGAAQRVSLTTVVHVHNALGRLYMLPVAPLHRRIAPAVLGRLVARHV